MSGIIFFGTKDLAALKDFYVKQAGMKIWLEQADCTLLQHGNLLMGFCERTDIEAAGIITLFYPARHDVDAMYEKFRQVALGPPQINKKYEIYNFFAKDPEGRKVEFQAFLKPTPSYLSGNELLLTRRSIRRFEATPVPDGVLWSAMEICRFAPTSRNSQSYYFVVIRDRTKIEFLAALRGENSAPIARAPIAVAICSDPTKTKRLEQDGCIAAYHFLLAAWLFGLGTCWIGAMDRDDAKEVLDIPRDHYIATVTPLGYPAERPTCSLRREAKAIVRFV